AAYNLGNKALTLTHLIKELQSYELMLNGEWASQIKLQRVFGLPSQKRQRGLAKQEVCVTVASHYKPKMGVMFQLK
ncbi:hypothetical protein J1N35_043645, partial [Gossypium stocksii]